MRKFLKHTGLDFLEYGVFYTQSIGQHMFTPDKAEKTPGDVEIVM